MLGEWLVTFISLLAMGLMPNSTTIEGPTTIHSTKQMEECHDAGNMVVIMIANWKIQTECVPKIPEELFKRAR